MVVDGLLRAGVVSAAGDVVVKGSGGRIGFAFAIDGLKLAEGRIRLVSDGK